jgi:hypothetical protein
MFSIQFESSLIVIEFGDSPPIRLVVAIGAIGLGVEFVRDVALMFAFMTIHALGADVAEMPLAIFLMASDTRRSFMSARKLEL